MVMDDGNRSAGLSGYALSLRALWAFSAFWWAFAHANEWALKVEG
jgi:hypothetical protein